MTNMTKASFDKGIWILDRKELVVYAGTYAHFYGSSFYGGLPYIVRAEELVRTVGMDAIVLNIKGEGELQYPVKDAPDCWRKTGLERWKGFGTDYDNLPEGNVELIGPFYPDDSAEIDEEVEGGSWFYVAFFRVP